MPNSCSAYKCKERYKKEEKENAEVQQSFFRFPCHNEELLSEWVAAVGRNNWYPSKTSVLCRNHFLEPIPAQKRPFASESDINIIAPSASLASFFYSSGEVPSCKVFKPAMLPSTKIKKLQLLVKKKNKKIKQLQRK
ncbi:THAP domain-containing 1-like [Paramuricea clavata]|uniref:THAP domain-containing 1-like n=1 Tax=Paramuricea clavata TaxID=317549 RepID=A0A7D9LTU6_PARCT|nr:THAP domain-containing 1-like [Paramuricea clavata]